MTRRLPRSTLLAATALCTGLAAAPLTAARADDATAQIGAIEKQIHALESQLNHMKRDLSVRDAEIRAARQEAAQASRQARETAERGAVGGVQTRASPGASLAAPPGFGAAQYTATTQGAFINSRGNPGYVPSGPALKQGQFALGGVRVTLGGFLEGAAIYRTRNEVADISSSFNTGIPFAQSANYHQGEFHESARQSRVSLLVEGSPNSVTQLSGYYEADFNSSGVTSNSTESNSYTLRARQLYATYARSDEDFYILGGQAYSLATMNKTGIVPHLEDLPLQIDAQFVVGFVWKRDAGLRVVKGFDHGKYNLGFALESPESSYYTGVNGTGLATGTTVTTTNAGLSSNGGSLNSTTTYSTEYAPDLVLKGTADPGWGHYELFGLARFLHDRVSVVGSGSSRTVVAGGVGGGAILPVIKNKVDFQLSGLVGSGIGTYGSGQLTDATLSRTGAPEPLPEVIALAGLVAHPVKPIDLYAYVGTEQITHREAYTIAGKGYGYGSKLYVNSGCDTELSTLVCTGNTSGLVEGTVGGWWRFLKGDFGTMQTGLQYAYVHRSTFSGVGGSPSTNENILMFSMRYLPFQ